MKRLWSQKKTRKYFLLKKIIKINNVGNENTDRLINNKEEFGIFSKEYQEKHEMPFAFGIGVNYKDSKKNTLATRWLSVNVAINEKDRNFGTASALLEFFNIEMGEKTPFCYKEFSTKISMDILSSYFHMFVEDDTKRHENVEALQSFSKSSSENINSFSVIFYHKEEFLTTQPIQNIADAHFRLALISRLKYKPNVLNLEKVFSTLPTLVWTSNGVFTPEEYNKTKWMSGEFNSLQILVDKFPPLFFGAPIPEGVRIMNPLSARLGAYLSPGTTIMPYGFVNFNAGTLGKAMVEGTITAGVTIGDGTDVGKGAGFLGTLSGGNTLVLSAGKDCLIGALAECGIPLGNNCVVSTGVCFTANTPFMEVSATKDTLRKAIDFSGIDNITFRRNASGQLEVIHKGNKAELNPALHAGG
ncbi:MAG: DapH/DapD/GlmU-related protein [Candidatus Nomurabacteria bacterium]|nr:DapH/DapD/GlmU-related protein [Candidatus Nomurabacteria bacterium]